MENVSPYQVLLIEIRLGTHVNGKGPRNILNFLNDALENLRALNTSQKAASDSIQNTRLRPHDNPHFRAILTISKSQVSDALFALPLKTDPVRNNLILHFRLRRSHRSASHQRLA
jgi:hypothetical protein